MTLRTYLVEDSAVIRENLVPTLEELAPVRFVGFAVDEPAALAWLALNAQDCDLLLIDIFLKRGSGLVVLRDAARNHRLCKVVLSNYATDEMRAQCLSLGAQRVFDKSNEIEALVEYCALVDREAAAPAQVR